MKSLCFSGVITHTILKLKTDSIFSSKKEFAYSANYYKSINQNLLRRKKTEVGDTENRNKIFFSCNMPSFLKFPVFFFNTVHQVKGSF